MAFQLQRTPGGWSVHRGENGPIVARVAADELKPAKPRDGRVHEKSIAIPAEQRAIDFCVPVCPAEAKEIADLVIAAEFKSPDDE